MDNCFLKDTCKKYKKDQSCDTSNFCIKLFKINELFDQCLVSEKQRKHQSLYIDEDLCDQEAFSSLGQIQSDILDFVRSGKNLFIYSSNVGNGKTSWALRMIQSYILNVWPESMLEPRCLFINVPRFFIELKNSINSTNDYINHIKEWVFKVDLVVWDEIGVKSLTSYEHENLLSLINTRLDKNQSNIYTSNIFGQELLDRVGERLYSRIVNLSDNIELKGKDKRGI